MIEIGSTVGGAPGARRATAHGCTGGGGTVAVAKLNACLASGAASGADGGLAGAAGGLAVG